MKTKRFVSTLLALLLICSLPLSAFAEEYDLSVGSVTVNASESGQTVSQVNGVQNHTETTPTVITQSVSSTPTENTVTITATENATANVTLEEVNIVISDDVLTDHGDEAAVTIDVADNASANVTLDGVNIDASGTGGDKIFEQFTGVAAVKITGNGDVTLELDGENTVQSGYERAGVEKNTTAATDTEPANGTGKLTITDETGYSGSLNVTGGGQGAGIGGGYSGIGDEGSASNITVSQNAQVKAQGGEAYQRGYDYFGAGAAIGAGGKWGENSSDPITGKEIKPNTINLNKGWVATYAPGTEDMNNTPPKSLIFRIQNIVTTTQSAKPIPKQEPTCTEAGTRAGFIVFETLGIPVTVGGETLPATGHSMGKFHTETAPTCQQAGLERSDCKNCDHYVTRSLDTVGHSYGEYTSDNNATCTSDGTKSRKCIWCQEPDPVTVPDPGSKLKHELEFHTVTAPTCQKEGLERADCKNCNYYETNILKKVDHSYGEYTSDNNASCTSDGTKTRKCIWCDLPDTVPDTGSKLKHELEFHTVTAPTCQKEGLERADCKNCNYYETNILKKVDHSYGEYTSDNNASCTSDGTKTRKCIWCDLPDTVPDPGSKLEHELGKIYTVTAPTCQKEGLERADCKNCNYYKTNILKKVGHSYGEYTSDDNATYTADGTKTAKCIWCDATNTIPDPGSKLVWVEDAPLYRVIDQDGKALACKAERKDGVLTITVDADFASLTGKLGGIQTLKAQGVDTIVFVTNGATSTFALADLLSQGSTGDSYTLTHDGAAVIFTLNNGADAGTILQ